MGRGRWPGVDARPEVSVEDGRTLLRVDGVIQSVIVDEHHEPDIWDAMVPLRRPANVLILGMGGGTVAMLLTRRFGAVPIVGVERDERIARIARETFRVDALPNVQVVVADAFDFVSTCALRFDLIVVDLYVAGKLVHGVFDPDFLRRLSHLVTPEGSIVFNLWSTPYLSDQLRRLQRMLDVRDVGEVGQNVIVRCGPRPLVAILPH